MSYDMIFWWEVSQIASLSSINDFPHSRSHSYFGFVPFCSSYLQLKIIYLLEITRVTKLSVHQVNCFNVSQKIVTSLKTI